MRKSITKALVHFSRNRRWGTCGDCPRTKAGDIFPEFCKYTERSDHLLPIEKLVDLILDEKRIQ